MQIAHKTAFAALAGTLALSSAAAFAATAPAGSTGAALGTDDMVHCYGVNACKGHADCKTTQHECKGMNSCKGQRSEEHTSELQSHMRISYAVLCLKQKQ